MFQPQHITYEEDRLRRDFFGDHPWELARPRVMLEDDGKDYQKWDWSQAHQLGRRADGEKYEPARDHLLLLPDIMCGIALFNVRNGL